MSAYIIFVIGFYVLPSLIALVRRHRNTGMIVALNIFLGWTLLGWLVALVYSFSANTRINVAEDRRAMADAINGTDTRRRPFNRALDPARFESNLDDDEPQPHGGLFSDCAAAPRRKRAVKW